MATTQDNTTEIYKELTPVTGQSDQLATDKVEINTDPIEKELSPQLDKGPDSPELKTEDPAMAVPKEDQQTPKKKVSTGNDFYDAFLDRQEATDQAMDLQSSESYWNNRPEDRALYEKTYGDKAKEVFEKDYEKVEEAWRAKLQEVTDQVSVNERYAWIFDDRADINYDTKPVAFAIHEIFNGSMRIGDMLTDKQMTDREAAIKSKRYMNDQGEFVELKDDEKWWQWSAGRGTAMNTDDPRHRSKDGKREIVAFEYDYFDPEFRGEPYIKALYEGDTSKGEVVSVWDTTNSWLLSNNKKTAGGLQMLPRTVIKTPVNMAVKMITGALSLANSTAHIIDRYLGDGDDNAFIKSVNSEINKFSARKFSQSDFDQSRMITPANALDLVAEIAFQIFTAKRLYGMAMNATKFLDKGNALLKTAATYEKAGDLAKAKKLIGQYEATHGFYARSASLIGLTLGTGDDIVKEARRRGFSEDEISAIYLSYFGAMLMANTITNRLIGPYFDDATLEPYMKRAINAQLGDFPRTGSDLAKLTWGRQLAKTLSELPGKIGKTVPGIKEIGATAGHTPRSMLMRSIVFRGANEAIEEEAEWFGQEVVEHLATYASRHFHKDNKEIPEFDTIGKDGYWARQLPDIMLSGFAGFLGGNFANFDAHTNEHSFLVQGEDKELMVQIASKGDDIKRVFLNTLQKQRRKNGAMGSTLLSTKINEKTGQFYKMSDPQAKGTLSQAEAAYNSILSQFLYYETLYGDGQHSLDEIKKLDPKIDEQLTKGEGHVFHKELSKLHTQKLNLLNELIGTPQPITEPSAAKAKASKSDKPAAPKKQKVDEAVSTKPDAGITAEPKPAEQLLEEKKKYDEEITTEIQERAALLGTTAFDKVRSLIETERKIDDILSGNAAVEQVARAVARIHKIHVFDEEEQKNIFSKIYDSAGNEIENPFLKFKGDLMAKIFSSDRNLARDHTRRHKDYLDSAESVRTLFAGQLTPENIHALAEEARKRPKSLAIDTHSIQLATLTNAVDELLAKTLPPAERVMLIATIKRNLGLNPLLTFEDYQKMLDEAVETSKILDGEFDLAAITDFIDSNLDLLHEISLVKFIEKIDDKVLDALTSNVSLNKKEYRNMLVNRLTKNGVNFDIDGNAEDVHNQIDDTEKLILKIQSDIDTLLQTETETTAEKNQARRQYEELVQQLSQAKEQLKTFKVKAEQTGPFDEILVNMGTDALTVLSVVSPLSELTPLVKDSTQNIIDAKQLIADYHTIRQNIAPVVPTVPKFGAVFELLNEVTTKGNSVVSNLNRIINESEEHREWATTDQGTVLVDRPKTRVEQLESMVRGKGDTAEFRNIEEAKLLLDAIEIRQGQLKLLQQMIPYIGPMLDYLDKHLAKGENKFDSIPRFLSEYVFDSRRYNELKKKTARTEEEQRDLDEMVKRLQLLVDFDMPTSVYARLKAAKTRVQELLSLGEKSTTSAARYKAYMQTIADSFNAIKQKILTSSAIQEHLLTNDAVKKAINEFQNAADVYSENDEETLLKGKALLDNVLVELYKLPLETKKAFIQAVFEFASTSHPYSGLFISSMIADPAEFNKYYKKALGSVTGNVIPTYSQELMVRETYSFLTSKTDLLRPIHEKSNLLFAIGRAGAGKTEMIGLGLTIAQLKHDAMREEALGDKAGDMKLSNNILFAAHDIGQSQNIKTATDRFGARTNATNVFDKVGLYKLLNGDPKNLDGVSIIAFDEATFIEGSNNETMSELAWFNMRIDEINATRTAGLPKLRMILVGDPNQGGFQTGMPRMFDEEVTAEPLDYRKLQGKTQLIGVPRTDELTYVFRTLCEKQQEITDSFLAVANAPYNRWTNAKTVDRLKVSSGTIINDPIRQRLGGTEVVRSKEALYADSQTTENIAKQLAVDPEFKVIIIDNEIKSLSELPAGPQLTKLIQQYPKNFVLKNIDSVQGQQCDYVLADLMKIMPSLPVTSTQNATLIQKVAMALSRAKFYAKIAVGDGVNIESVDNALISMLPADKAEELATKWKEFYIQKFWNTTITPATTLGSTSTGTAVGTSDGEEQGPVITNTDYSGIAVDLPTETAEDQDVRKAQAILDDRGSSEAEKLDAQKVIDSAYKNLQQVEDVYGKAPRGAEDVDPDNVVMLDKMHAPLQNVLTLEDEARAQMERLEDLGYLSAYTYVINDKNTTREPRSNSEMKVLYASDIFGHRGYKNDQDSYKVLDTAVKETSIASSVFRGSDPVAKSKYVYSLVSHQTQDSFKRDIVVHQIFAKLKSGGPKVLVANLPFVVLSKNKPAAQFLKAREDALVKIGETLTAIGETTLNSDLQSILPVDGGIFTEKELFGLADIMQNPVIAATNPVFPELPAGTVLGRTGLSTESSNYAKEKLPAKHQNVGTFYLETTIQNPDELFIVPTAGKPVRASYEAMNALISLAKTPEEKSYLMELPSSAKQDFPIATDIKAHVLQKSFTNDSLDYIVRAGYTVPVLGGNVMYTKNKKGIIGTTIVIKAQNGRKLAFYADPNEQFRLIFGFGADGTPIIPDAAHRVSDDIEVKALMLALGVNNTVISGTPATLDPSNATIALASVYGYTPATLNIDANSSPDIILDEMSKNFMKTIVVPRAELKLTLAQLRKVLELTRPDVQVSPPMIITKTTKNNHQGKMMVLYTANPKHEGKLADPVYLSKILKGMSMNKATDQTKEGFDIKAFTREGIGVIMLDAKPTSFEELNEWYKSGIDTKSLNRAASPVGSASNRRLVGFIKTLADTMMKVDPVFLGRDAERLNNYSKFMKMGLDDNNKAISDTDVFDADGIRRLTELLTKLEQERNPIYDSLKELIYTIVHDRHLGAYKISPDNLSDEIQEFFRLSPPDRIDYYKAKIEQNPVLKAELESMGVIDGLPNEGIITDEFSGHEAISGRAFIDSLTGNPIVVNNNHALTFMEPIAGLPRSEAVFNPLKFLRTVSKRLPDPDQAQEVLRLFDSIMRNYTKKGTLNQGLLYGGKKTTALDPSVRISLLDPTYAETHLMTSVKDINEPAVMVNINKLIQLGTPLVPTPGVPGGKVTSNPPAPNVPDLDIEARKKAMEEQLKPLVIPAFEVLRNPTATVSEKIEATKTALSNIKKMLVDSKLYNTKEINSYIIGARNAFRQIDWRTVSSTEAEALTELEARFDKSTELTKENLNQLLSEYISMLSEDVTQVWPRASVYKFISGKINESTLIDENTKTELLKTLEMYNPDTNQDLIDFNDPVKVFEGFMTAEMPGLQEFVSKINTATSPVFTPEQIDALQPLYNLFTNISAIENDKVATDKAMKLLAQIPIIAASKLRLPPQTVSKILDELDSLQNYTLDDDENENCNYPF